MLFLYGAITSILLQQDTNFDKNSSAIKERRSHRFCEVDVLKLNTMSQQIREKSKDKKVGAVHKHCVEIA